MAMLNDQRVSIPIVANYSCGGQFSTREKIIADVAVYFTTKDRYRKIICSPANLPRHNCRKKTHTDYKKTSDLSQVSFFYITVTSLVQRLIVPA